MGQIKVVESKSQKKEFVFHELKTGEVFRDGLGTLYLKIDRDTVFNLTSMHLYPAKVNPVLDVYPVNATLTVEE
jgi:hypothetical protein